tara:strand:- start:281 stop:673 length:393 start_codon:yes stop_codon:yes gene_type:complete
MQDIVRVAGKQTGPSGSMVEPRACKYCGYYGHTRQHCQTRLRDEEASAEAYVLQWQQEQMQLQEERDKWKRDEAKELPWYQRESQEAWFDELGVPWYRDKHVGALPLSPGKDGAQGKWVWDGRTVKIADE